MTELKFYTMMSNIDDDLILMASQRPALHRRPRFRTTLLVAAIALLLVASMLIAPFAVAISYMNAHPELDGGLIYVMDAILKDEDHFLYSLLPEGIRNTLGSVFDALTDSGDTNEDETQGETQDESESRTDEQIQLPVASEGLEFVINDTHDGYKLMGMGTCMDKELVIPAEHNGLPVTEIFWNSTMGNHAFEQNTEIESVIIPASVQTICDYAFYQCTSVKSITILPGDQPVEIGYGSFGECKALEQMSIPDNVIRFSDPFLLSSTNISTNRKVFPKAVEYDNAYYLGNENNPYFVLISVKDKALDSCLIHPDTKIIGGGAFYESALTEIVIPEGVVTIDDQAFSQTAALKTFSFPDSLRFVGKEAFIRCGAIDSYSDFDYVGDKENPYLIMFDAQIISEDNIHPDTRYIADEAFNRAKRITPQFKSLTIPEQVRYIGKYAFSNASSSIRLKSLTIQGDNLYIGKNILPTCGSLESIHIGKGVSYITPGTFGMVPALGSITVDPDNPVYTVIDNCLIEPQSGTLLLGCKNSVVPTDGSIKHIAKGAFLSTGQLPLDAIPEGVLSIGSFAFYYNSGIREMTIPASVTCIHRVAFDSGWTIHYNGTKEEWLRIQDNALIAPFTVICTDGEIVVEGDN